MSRIDALRTRRRELEDWLNCYGLSNTLSASRYLLHTQVRGALLDTAEGRILEVGAGRSPFRPQLRRVAAEVVALDIEDRFGGIDILGDVQDMHQIGDAEFDTVLCTQVLEHVPDPNRALAEIRRVLKPGGVMILSAPHLSMVHEAPNDFFRFTRYGLAVLCEGAGFGDVSIEPTSGIVAFLAHPLSLAWLTIGTMIPLVRWPVWALNYSLLILPVVLLDAALGVRGLFPTDHVVVARVPA